MPRVPRSRPGVATASESSARMRSVLKLAYGFHRGRAWILRLLRQNLTPAGLAALAGVVVSGITGIEMERSVVYQVFTLLLGLLVVASTAAVLFRGRFRARRVLPRFGTAGQPLCYTVLVKNDTGRAQRDLRLIEELAEPAGNFETFAAARLAADRRVRAFFLARRESRAGIAPAIVREVPIPTVPPGGEVETTVELLPLRRGHLRFDGVAIARPDPLGLVKSLARVKAPQSLLILPRRYPTPAFALPGTAQYQPGGVAMASAVGESEEFVSLRDYRPGDPPRRLHWRSWARAGRPIVKEFADEFFVRHALVLDTFTDPAGLEAFEEAVSVAASFACALLTQESLLDLLFVGPQACSLTAGRGVAHLEQILEVLAAVRWCPRRDFPALEALVLEHAARVSGCVCVLLAWDEPRRAFVRKLRERGLPLRVIVVVERGAAAALGVLEEDVKAVEVGAIEEGLATA